MGGFGSGRPSGSGRDTVESCRSIDKAGCLRPGYWGGWQRTRDGERVADIRLRTEAQRLVLSYRIRRNAGEWEDVEQPTPVVWVPCRFGGKRPYFVQGSSMESHATAGCPSFTERGSISFAETVIGSHMFRAKIVLIAL
jgi:hypothetical protein